MKGWLKIWLRYARPIIKSLLGAATLLLPPIFPDALKYEPGHPLPWILKIFGIMLLGLAIWEAIDESKKQVTESTPLQQPTFIDKYSGCCANAIKIVQDIPGYTAHECDQAVTAVLKIIHTVVGSYAEDGNKDHLNINVMRPFQFSRERAAKIGSGLHFYDANMKDDVYTHILELTHWASDNHCTPEGFSLPVHKNRRELLFGAPQAFITGEIQVIGNIQDKKTAAKLSEDQPRTIKEDIRRYLAERTTFRCFVCVRLEYAHRNVGILNIQAAKPRAFGDQNSLTAEMRDFILPLCQPLFEVLGMVLAGLEEKTSLQGAKNQTVPQALSTDFVD